MNENDKILSLVVHKNVLSFPPKSLFSISIDSNGINNINIDNNEYSIDEAKAKTIMMSIGENLSLLKKCIIIKMVKECLVVHKHF